MTKEPDWKELVDSLKSLFEDENNLPESDAICSLLADEAAADIALAIEELEPEQAIQVFHCLNRSMARDVLMKIEPDLAKSLTKELDPGELSELVDSLPPREAALIVTEASRKQVREFVKDELSDPSAVREVESRMVYPKQTAGRLMTTQFVRLHRGTSIKDAIEVVKHTDPDIDIPENLYIVDRKVVDKKIRNHLLGVISIRDLLMCDPTKKVDDIMETEIITISANTAENDAAALMAKYKFMTLPVLDKDGFLVGVIPSDDLMQVVVARLRKRYSKAVGTDAERMEKLTPLQEAKMRVPWLLGTMVIELGAGLVISHYDQVLEKVILLASFMPVISAISGNVGLQAAAITVRAVDTQSQNKGLWHSIRKEASTSLIMAAVCGIVLGLVGVIWSQHLPFGIVIGGALTCSMLTAGIMGAVIPIISKRLGFDPATTAGPFETAFQDVVGFGVFLWLATMLQDWIS